MVLEPREGERPDVSNAGPQMQLSQQSPPQLWGLLVARTFALPGVEEGHSQVSPASSRAVFIREQRQQLTPETSLAPGKRLEPVHLHGVADTSIHLCLPAARGRELTELGWAEAHQFGDFGTEFFVYGPRDEEELEIVLALIGESLTFARGE